MPDLIMPRHPLTGLEAVGIVGGRPVWPILGGSEPAPEAGAAGVDPAGGVGVAAAQGQAGATAATLAAGAAPSDPDVADDDDAAKLVARMTPAQLASIALRYRKEAGDRRIAAAGAEKTAEQKAADAADAERARVFEQLKPALIAAGLVTDDSTPDPAKLATDLQAQTTAAAEQAANARTLTIENTVLRSANGLGINADRLLDSRRFAAAVASLDPTADDFGSKIEAAMKDAATKDTSLKLRPGAGRGGALSAGGSGEGPKFAAAPLYDAVAAAMNPTV